jgi:4'-phosphopantetheinyl transferase
MSTPCPATVDLWLVATDAAGSEDLAALQATLTPAEQEHLAQRRSPQAQRRFLLSRGCLRSLLGRYTHRSPAELSFTYGPQGKPALAAAPLPFNLSHSGPYLLVGIGTASVKAIGVDIECLRPVRRRAGLCRRCLTPADASTVLALAPPHADHRFLRYWTGKEACLKALGQGLADRLQTLELTLTPALAPRPMPLGVARLSGEGCPDWLYQWQPTPCTLAAVAIQSTPAAPVACRLRSTTVAQLIRYGLELPMPGQSAGMNDRP